MREPSLRAFHGFALALWALTLAGCGDQSPTDPVSTLPVANIAVVSGDAQFGRTGEALASPVVVRATSAGGEPVGGAGVTFTIVSGGGQLSHASAETDASGLAQTFWTLGGGPEHALRVASSHPGSDAEPANLTATNELVLHIQVVSGADQSAPAGEALAAPVVVRVKDCYGETISGVSVGFDVVRGGGTVTEAAVTTGATGEAQVSWVMGAGPDNRLQVRIQDDTYSSANRLVAARTELQLTFQWTSDLPFVGYSSRVPNDNRILESNHVLTFSDAASDSAKRVFAELTERSLAELIQDFEISSVTNLGIDPSEATGKINVYSARDVVGLRQQAFYEGFILYGVDSEPYRLWYGHQPEYFEREVKHETLHVLHFRLAGRNGFAGDFWFQEGIAEYASGGAFPRIETWEGVVAWAGSDRHINPIRIRRKTADLPIPAEACGEYYPMFHLAMEYLLSDDGWGRSYADVKNMWADMAAGTSFDVAFQTHFGLTVEAFENAFYDLIRDYLEQKERV